MNERQAKKLMSACKTLAERLSTIPDYSLTGQDLKALAGFNRVYRAGLAEDAKILAVAGLSTDAVVALMLGSGKFGY